MARNWQVNGPAIVWAGVGSGNAPASLGYTETGVQARKFRWVEPLKGDVGGQQMPMEFQEQGEAMLLSCKFVVFDTDVLDLIRSRGDKATVGQINSIGALIGQRGYAFELWVAGTNGRPHHCITATLYDGERFNLGTKRTEDDMQFYVWPLVDPTADTALDTELFDYDGSAIGL